MKEAEDQVLGCRVCGWVGTTNFHPRAGDGQLTSSTMKKRERAIDALGAGSSRQPRTRGSGRARLHEEAVSVCGEEARRDDEDRLGFALKPTACDQ